MDKEKKKQMIKLCIAVILFAIILLLVGTNNDKVSSRRR